MRDKSGGGLVSKVQSSRQPENQYNTMGAFSVHVQY